MAKTECTAVIEMNRLRGASAWSPIALVISRKRNQYSNRLTFQDGSQLAIYFNGDAAWFHRADNGDTDGWQRWRSWHHCNR